MIILKVDNNNKGLKLTSLAMDTLVYTPGKGYDKLNHSFAYGGVEVNIEDIEVEGLNKAIDACYVLEIENKGNNIEYITSGAYCLLNGYEELAYCRLRKIDNCFYRDARQGKVLKSLAYKLSNVSVFKYLELIRILLKYRNVNIFLNKILDLAIISRELTNY